MKGFLVDVPVLSILTSETDANPVNGVVQVLSDFETKIQEAWRQTTSRESSNWCESQTSDLAFAVQTEHRDRADWVAQLGATSEAMRTEIDDFARSVDPMPI